LLTEKACSWTHKQCRSLPASPWQAKCWGWVRNFYNREKVGFIMLLL